ncbi:hypothetical protein ABZU45_06325 [Streptomyces avermitilis]|uniref:hypothetical protein n=1 Tax=Streptomyces avermitilis TaxID=33903 RepID=UPI0033A3A973
MRFTTPHTEEAEILQGLDALRNGAEYPVLEVFTPHGKNALFRIEFIQGEDSALFDSRAFTVTSNSLPTTWRYFQFDTGSTALRPESWSQTGFWEAYYDRDPWAVEVYETERRNILASP